MKSLFEYQKKGCTWLASRRFALLADEMGLGKTPQAIVAAGMAGCEKILVVCPAVARVNWSREFSMWSTLPHSLEIVSYEHATKHAEVLRKKKRDLLIIDETHFLKSVDAKRSKAILGREGVCRVCDRVWALSGTPAPNHAGELWILLYTFGVTKLSHREFIERYCVTIEGGYGLRVVGTKKDKIPELRELLSRVMLRRKKSEVLTQLPPIFFSEYTVEPGRVNVDVEFLEKVAAENSILDSRLCETFTDEQKLGALEALATSVSTLRRYRALQKIEPVTELLKHELDSGLVEKVVVFANHRAAVETLTESLREYGAVSVFGGISPENKQKNIDRFQSDKSCRVFVGNILACGTAITLTSAHQVVFLEQDWVPGNNAQAAMRCHRVGQQHPVNVRFVTLNDPVDKRVTKVLAKKSSELAQIFDF